MRTVFRTVLVSVFFLMANAGAQSVDEILAKNLKTKGGIEKLRAISTQKAVGTMNMQAMGIEGAFTVFQKRPNQIRIDIEVMGNSISQVFDGNEAWMISPVAFGGTGGPMAMPEAQSLSFADQADFDGPFVDYQKKGHKIELVGKEDMDGTEVYHLKVMMASGREMHFFLDTENCVELKVTSREFNPQAGGEVEQEQILSDYKPVDGILVPHSVESRIEGNTVVRLTFSEISFGVPVPEGHFSKPTP